MLDAPKQLGNTTKPLPPIPSSAKSGRRISSAPAKTQEKRDDANGNQDALRLSNVDRPAKTEGQPSCVDESSFFTPRQNVVSPEERVFLTQVI